MVASLYIKTDLENVTDLAPTDDCEWYFKDIYEISGSRGSASLVMRCKFCKREGTAQFEPSFKIKKYNIEQNGKFQQIAQFDCRGLELVDFQPRDSWLAKGAESDTVFNDIDLSEGEWAEYDEKSGEPVGIIPFHERDYWESRFKKEKHFEWLLTWKDIQSEVETYLNKSENILHLGCGNSELPFDMSDAGYKRIVNIDYAETVIRRMKAVTQEKQKDYSGLSWYTGDCLNNLISFLPHENYTTVIDKSLVDTIACSDDNLQSNTKKFADQVLQVTTVNAVWISISFSNERIYNTSPSSTFYWKTEKKIPIEVHQENDKPGAPAIYYYIYINKKVQK
ncbi:hypothetical protein G6F57_009721 [Rhizopus arrhizus]|uniref:Methyltransferase domain-containing protein n=1 Tax=Rhizopus oryzae TaxID=64495 RepID=A0A9P6X3B0_RHIOR|nr:hypothetical protein G6F23_006073 [Rhizopus arrhizus]KAG1414409.1 hypothetical protein G6F58_006973 [Rhizopus delemar]KAG0758693.1 hypothetical protein G6F24_009616 [Rhizopus arrhizus]KAG0784975.1 hypothetical protein G6F21_009563 [Rhizopus arrhizus]KAG0793294.1 hypothetical protein G6F22_005640 [Rhizopus arrhizus]